MTRQSLGKSPKVDSLAGETFSSSSPGIRKITLLGDIGSRTELAVQVALWPGTMPLPFGGAVRPWGTWNVVRRWTMPLSFGGVVRDTGFTVKPKDKEGWILFNVASPSQFPSAALALLGKLKEKGWLPDDTYQQVEPFAKRGDGGERKGF